LRAGSGETIATTDWAAALDADSELADAKLSAREREILALYASGEKAQSVAYRTGLSRDTVANYISRIRVKYANVGRPAHTKVDLHRRAIEDGLMPDGL
jgi:DNA-binding CsgD family transcriptional regulator